MLLRLFHPSAGKRREPDKDVMSKVELPGRNSTWRLLQLQVVESEQIRKPVKTSDLESLGHRLVKFRFWTHCRVRSVPRAESEKCRQGTSDNSFWRTFDHDRVAVTSRYPASLKEPNLVSFFIMPIFLLVRIMPTLLMELPWPSSCLPVRQHSGADLGFQHLANFGARKVIPDFNLLGRFDAPDPLLHEGRYCGDIDGASCSRLHHSDNAFAPLLVWQADDGTILNGFVRLKGVLNFN